MKIAILILAAGTSSRMGTPKQLLPIGNTTLLGLAIENALNTKANTICCVLGAHAKRIKQETGEFPVNVIINTNYNSGLSSSIVAGIHELQDYDAVLIMLADQPKIDTNYLNRLITSFTENSDNISASDYGKKVGVPAIFPKMFYSELLTLKGDKGARDMLQSTKNTIKLRPESLIDIDTQEEYFDFLNQ